MERLDDRRRRREAAERPCRGAPRGRVQHIFVDIETARERRRALDAAAAQAGRGPLIFSAMLRADPFLSGTAAEAAELLREYEAAGLERVMIQHLAHEELEPVAFLGEVARLVA